MALDAEPIPFNLLPKIIVTTVYIDASSQQQFMIGDD